MTMVGFLLFGPSLKELAVARHIKNSDALVIVRSSLLAASKFFLPAVAIVLAAVRYLVAPVTDGLTSTWDSESSRPPVFDDSAPPVREENDGDPDQSRSSDRGKSTDMDDSADEDEPADEYPSTDGNDSARLDPESPSAGGPNEDDTDDDIDASMNNGSLRPLKLTLELGLFYHPTPTLQAPRSPVKMMQKLTAALTWTSLRLLKSQMLNTKAKHLHLFDYQLGRTKATTPTSTSATKNAPVAQGDPAAAEEAPAVGDVPAAEDPLVSQHFAEPAEDDASLDHSVMDEDTATSPDEGADELPGLWGSSQLGSPAPDAHSQTPEALNPPEALLADPAAEIDPSFDDPAWAEEVATADAEHEFQEELPFGEQGPQLEQPFTFSVPGAPSDPPAPPPPPTPSVPEADAEEEGEEVESVASVEG
ncbi:hypothetical protein B0T14DRAFT_598341 [Immersiella caudata]|uniref:Uncharacterized protein n=1 Tax=Immersiella caudata TaxID=314043 RepID=A0AA39XFF5_9PEZI|nr:hypothetical protein B0T14DRAFT_598341 [Immersiella caudata]